MTSRQKSVAQTVAAMASVAVVLAFTNPPTAQADDSRARGDARVERGLRIAPVPLDLKGKSRTLVGIGSYIVNAQGACNDCHTNPSFAPGGDPFQGQQKVVNAAGYLGGGVAFGPFLSRNLTPNGSGETLGGDSFEEFRRIMRTGVDPDQLHPQFGPFLQVMPWPVYQEMSDDDLRAIYEYLGAIPCVEGGPGQPASRCSN
jgi:hypothetical protein